MIETQKIERCRDCEPQKIERCRDCEWCWVEKSLPGHRCGMRRYAKVNPGWYACMLGRPARKRSHVDRCLTLLQTSVAKGAREEEKMGR